MDIKELKTEFIISEVQDHSKHKLILLDLINKIPNNPYEGISKTDYNLPVAFERKYLDYFYLHIAKNIMDQQQKYFKAQGWDITYGWFQQYQEKSGHQYHTHPKTNFTNIYFLELPDKQLKTSVKVKDKEYCYSAKEGQIITFPAHLLHCSKPIRNKRKTIISFNSDFVFSFKSIKT